MDLETCFNLLFYPPEDIEKTADNQQIKSNPFTCMEESKIGNTFYLVETGYGSMEPHPYKLMRLILFNRYSFLKKLPISNDFSDNKVDC